MHAQKKLIEIFMRPFIIVHRMQINQWMFFVVVTVMFCGACVRTILSTHICLGLRAFRIAHFFIYYFLCQF